KTRTTPQSPQQPTGESPDETSTRALVPPGDFVEGRQTQELWLRPRYAVITRRGYLPEIPRMGYLVRWIPPRSGLVEPGLVQRPAAPGELLLVPAGQPCERDAVVRRLDEPAVADVDRRVEEL